jgi:hypothetical protein
MESQNTRFWIGCAVAIMANFLATTLHFGVKVLNAANSTDIYFHDLIIFLNAVL